jgi:hypothetical protein
VDLMEEMLEPRDPRRFVTRKDPDERKLGG